MPRSQYPSLAEVLRQTVKRSASGIPAETVADLLGKPYATLMSELSGQPGHKLGADLVLPLMEITGSDAALHFLAREMGGAFVRLPQAAPGAEPVQRQCLIAVREFGELVGRTAQALADDRLTAQERREILREGHEAVTAIMALLRQVEGGREP
jgi:hypothetical protein